jgi:trk system potassium uptake protein
MARMHGRALTWSSPVLFVISFAVTIFIGSLLLWLPAAHSSGESLPFIDALFQSASAVCITGLVTINVGTDLSRFGQIVVLCLFQIGALGIMTYSLSIVGVVQRRSSPDQNVWFANVFTKDRKLPPSRMLRWIITLMIVVEVLGALSMWAVFSRDYDTAQALYMGVFHSISAYSNAGFSLFSDNLASYRNSLPMNLIVCAMITIGGLGFVVTFESWRSLTGRRRWFKLLLQTKLVLAAYGVLFLSGVLFILLFESQGLLKGEPIGSRILTAVFQSTTRTAGFSTVDIGSMTDASLLVMMVLMFIGGAPGSTAGGIKVTTAAVLLMSVLSRYRSGGRPQVFNRSIPIDTITRAAVLVVGGVVIVMTGMILLQVTEMWGVSHTQTRGVFLELLFETVSAFGTVGLSTGITPSLSTAGKSIIIVLMFVGRVGPLTLAAILLGSRRSSHVKYPEEDVMIG